MAAHSESMSLYIDFSPRRLSGRHARLMNDRIGTSPQIAFGWEMSLSEASRLHAGRRCDANSGKITAGLGSVDFLGPHKKCARNLKIGRQANKFKIADVADYDRFVLEITRFGSAFGYSRRPLIGRWFDRVANEPNRIPGLVPDLPAAVTLSAC
jgi:hypothetical protein